LKNHESTQPIFTGSITTKTITVTGATVAPKVYDGNNAAVITGGTLTGVVGSEDVQITKMVTSGTYADANAGIAKVVTTAPMTITGTDVGNYTFNQPLITGDITKAELTVTANNKSRCFNTANPVFDYSISGFVNNETSSVIDAMPVASSTATQSSAAGTYPITLSGGADNNYSFNYVNGQLSVKAPATPVITANDKVLHSNVASGNQWYNENGLINGATNQDYTVTSDGKYFVIVTASGCSSDSSNIIAKMLVKPQILNYNISEITSTGAKATFTCNKDGIVRYVVITSLATVPTAQQIFSGAAISALADSGRLSVTANVAASVNLKNLIANTNYTIYAAMKNNMDSISEIVSKDFSTRTNANNTADFIVKIYPNPVNDVLQISTDELNENSTYSIFTLIGGKLMDGKMINGQARVNMEKYSSGTYILRITSGKYTNEYKIVKK
jgi:hypothetical protein